MRFDQFGRAIVQAEAERRAVSVEELLIEAALQRLADRESRRMAWRVPHFQRDSFARPAGRSAAAQDLSVSLMLTDEDWHALEADADRQGVPLELLLRHAALCLLADLDRAA
jgi:hypothetical protein